jgi:hypothetical protein
MKFKTISTYKPFTGRTFSCKSITVPDTTLSLREIISNYARGIVPENITEFSSDNDLDFENPTVDPLVDIVDDPLTYQQELKDKINAYRRELYRYSKSSISRSVETSETERSDVKQVSERPIEVENNET